MTFMLIGEVVGYLLQLPVKAVHSFIGKRMDGLDAHALDEQSASADGAVMVDATVGTGLLTQFIEGIAHLVVADAGLGLVDCKVGYLSHLVVVLLLIGKIVHIIDWFNGSSHW